MDMTASGAAFRNLAGDERSGNSCDFLWGNTLRIVKSHQLRDSSDKSRYDELT